jgi:hypothetical protein
MALRILSNPAKATPRMPLLKRLFWVYFLLLIFEGALRKWVVPQLSTPLLLVRDPVALLIVWEAYRTNKWPKQWSAVTGILAAGLLGLAMVQLVAGDNPWFAALFGMQSYLLPFPVAFIMGENLDAEDLRKFGNCILWLLLLLTAIEVMQYRAPADSFWNAGASEGATQLGYTGEHVRASATFSYVMGPMLYIPMAAAFIFYGMANPGFAKKWLLWAAAGALVLSIPVTGSRTVVYEMAALLLCMVVAAFFGVSQFAKSLQMIVVLVAVSGLVSQLPVFSEATGSLSQRFAEASGVEGGNAEASFLFRVIQPASDAIVYGIYQNDPIGIGLGRGANAITKLMTGQVTFAAGEGPISRIIVEFGLPCGLAFLLFRLLLEIAIVAKALSRAREGAPLAWLLVPVTFNCLPMGTQDQPTVQGFMVVSVAFSLAAIKGVSVPVQAPPEMRQLPRQRRLGLRAG